MSKTKEFTIDRHLTATLDHALLVDEDLLQRHRLCGRLEFFTQQQLLPNQETMQRIAAFQLGIDAECVKARPDEDWKTGTYNIAIPMFARDGNRPTDADAANDDLVPDIIFRCPIPAECAEDVYPGTVEEKMRSEVAAYVWMQRHCPDVRIPFLHGFSFPGGRHFSHCSHVSAERRSQLRQQQQMAVLEHRPIPSDYLPEPIPSSVFQTSEPIQFGYMILEFLGPSIGRRVKTMVANADFEKELQTNPQRVDNLFRSVARIRLSLARIPQPRIGSFSFSDDGTIALDHRPVTNEMVRLESWGGPRTMPLDQTYSSAKAYVSALADMHDAYFRAAPHTVLNRDDFMDQAGKYVLCRKAIEQLFKAKNYEEEAKTEALQYRLRFEDDNHENLLVDFDWNVTAIFDLEWMISSPADMLSPPGWLTWGSLDELMDDHYEKYDTLRKHFMGIFQDEEVKMTLDLDHPLTDAIQNSWETQRYWLYVGLNSTNVLYWAMEKRLQPLLYGKDEKPDWETLYLQWDPAAEEIMEAKLQDREKYVAELTKLFE